MIMKLMAAAGLGAVAVTATPKLIDAVNDKPIVMAQNSSVAPSTEVPQKIVPVSKTDAQRSYAPVVRASSHSVVNVYARSIQKGRVAVDPFWGAFRIPDRASQSQGSGVIVRDSGIIVTNNHVVEGATELVVVLGDRREFPATVIVADSRTDLAVLKIDTKGQKLSPISFANTNDAEVGDQVLAIGNPFGVGQTVTSGIISALARTDVGITDYSFFIQTDASINPGNSGGALVDMNGNLVGINTAIFSQSGSSAGVGFAIPAEMVKRIVDGALTSGKVIRTWSGIKGQSVTSELANTMNLPKPVGVLVTEVYPNSAAASAGLKRGDVIIVVNDSEVNDESTLRYLIATKAPNETAVFKYYRAGKILSSKGTITELPKGNDDSKKLAGKNSFTGATIATITPAIADEKGLDPFAKGVVVTAVDENSIAYQSGFRVGDIILEINGEAINSVKDIESKLGGNKQGQVTITRQNRAITAILIL